MNEPSSQDCSVRTKQQTNKKEGPMKSIKLNRFPCDQCGFNEDVEENKKPVIIPVTVGGNPYQLCPDCVYKTDIWKEHVKLDDLRNPIDPKLDGNKHEDDKNMDEVMEDIEHKMVQVIQGRKKTLELNSGGE